jgi:predicted RecB family endonuclease
MTGSDKDPMSRAQELESVVDQLDAKVAREREAEGVPGNSSDRERAATRGSENEPPD